MLKSTFQPKLTLGEWILDYSNNRSFLNFFSKPGPQPGEKQHQLTVFQKSQNAKFVFSQFRPFLNQTS